MPSPISLLFLRDIQHGGPADQAGAVAARLARFIAAARSTVDIAIYDFRLSDPLAQVVVGALLAAAGRGVRVRIAFDAGKPDAAGAAAFAGMQADPAPPGTGDWVNGHFGGTAVAVRPITAPAGQLMHHKYVVRDAGGPRAALWTGSANFTDDAWQRQENNLLTIPSPEVAAGYAADFAQLWQAGKIDGTGGGAAGSATVHGATVGWDFCPADGPGIDATLVGWVGQASTRIVVASMVLTSHPLLAALAAAIDRGVPVTGIYDAGQMDPIAALWAANPHDADVLAHWNAVAAQLVAKHSTPYTPTGPHDFMHDKVLVVDDQLATGSYNLSANAQRNAENQLHLRDPHLVDRYLRQIRTISRAYRQTS